MRSFISGLMENWLFARKFDLKALAPTSRRPAGDVSIVSDAARVDYQRPNSDNIFRGNPLATFCVAILFAGA